MLGPRGWVKAPPSRSTRDRRRGHTPAGTLRGPRTGVGGPCGARGGKGSLPAHSREGGLAGEGAGRVARRPRYPSRPLSVGAGRPRPLTLPLLVAPGGAAADEGQDDRVPWWWTSRPKAYLCPSYITRPTAPRGSAGASTCAVYIGFHRRSFGLYLTLFSKSFSPFPRGTCVISVSGRYLALEGGHLPPSRCTPKQRYSRTVRSLPGCTPCCTGERYGTDTLCGAAF